MKWALFLGCTIPARGRNYEMAARQVAARLGIELTDINEFSCCGFPVKATEREFALVMCARNLALAEAQGANVCALCSACTAMLTDARHALAHDAELFRQVNLHLHEIGLEYRGTATVKHFSRLLYEDVGVEVLRQHITCDLSAFAFAPHYGCHYLKPAEIYDAFDQVETPETLSRLIELTGAKVADLGNRKHCCGGALLATDKSITYRMAGQKLHQAKAAGADALCVICPFCAVIYDDNQKAIEGENGEVYDLPALYYPQILGLAMGIDANDLGLQFNRVKTQALLARLQGKSAL